MEPAALPPSPAAWLRHAARRTPEAPALYHDQEVWSYADLEARVAALARRLGAWSGPAGGGLAVLSRDRLLTALLLHAAPRAGLHLLPLNPDLPAALLGRLLRLGGATRAVTDGSFAPDALPTLTGAQLLAAEPGSGTSVAEPLAVEAIHLVIATSGSSGEPKAVPLSGLNLAAAVAGSRSVLPLGPGDVWLACLPLFHVGGASILLRAAAAGAAVVLHQRFVPEAVLADLAARAVTHLSLVPAMLARLLEVTGAAPPRGLRHVLMGGAALPGPLAERALAAGWPLCASYGMTEAASQVATRCGLRPGWRPGDVGPPLPGMEVEIVPEPGVATTTGVGRIRVRGPAVMGGYAGSGRPTGAGIEAGWFVTGDLGRLAPDGSLTVLGRADEVVVTGGENVHPAQVEAALSGCPGIVEAGVVALDDPVWGARLVAFVTGEAAPGAVLAWARAHLPSPWRPRAVHHLVALPRNASGKLDRMALRARAERLAGASAPPPTSGSP